MRDMVRSMRPAGGGKPYAVRFETLPGQQAQVDFVQFQVRFAVTPDRVQVVWLFSLVLGFSRLIWGGSCCVRRCRACWPAIELRSRRSVACRARSFTIA